MWSLMFLFMALPPAGIRESSDYGLSERMLAQVAPDIDLAVPAKKSVRTPDSLRGGVRKPEMDDPTPATDKAADAITASLKDTRGKVRPRIADKNTDEVIRMAESLGRPVIEWVNFWPEYYTGSAEFFIEMEEAQHVVRVDRANPGSEYIVFRMKDRERVWVDARKLDGKKSAEKIRAVWIGERAPKAEARYTHGDPDLLTRNEKRELLDKIVTVTQPSGRQEKMTIRQCVDRGGKMTAEVCERLGLSEDQGAFVMALEPRGQPTSPVYSGGGMSGATRGAGHQTVPAAIYAGGAYAGGTVSNVGYGYSHAAQYGGSFTAPAQPRTMMPTARAAPPPAPRGSFSGPIRGG